MVKTAKAFCLIACLMGMAAPSVAAVRIHAFGRPIISEGCYFSSRAESTNVENVVRTTPLVVYVKNES